MARFAFLTVMATEPPYRLPANIDLERMVRNPTSTAKAIVKYLGIEGDTMTNGETYVDTEGNNAASSSSSLLEDTRLGQDTPIQTSARPGASRHTFNPLANCNPTAMTTTSITASAADSRSTHSGISAAGRHNKSTLAIYNPPGNGNVSTSSATTMPGPTANPASWPAVQTITTIPLQPRTCPSSQTPARRCDHLAKLSGRRHAGRELLCRYPTRAHHVVVVTGRADVVNRDALLGIIDREIRRYDLIRVSESNQGLVLHLPRPAGASPMAHILRHPPRPPATRPHPWPTAVQYRSSTHGVQPRRRGYLRHSESGPKGRGAPWKRPEWPTLSTETSASTISPWCVRRTIPCSWMVLSRSKFNLAASGRKPTAPISC